MLLERPDQLEGKKFDLITSNLLLRTWSCAQIGADPSDHVAKLDELFELCASLLKPGGRIAHVDFEDAPGAELFHPKHKHHDVDHHGTLRRTTSYI